MKNRLLAAKLHGKTAIVVKDAPGFAVNRFFVPFLNEAARMLEEDLADIPTIEEAAKRAFKIGMGPFLLMNVTGIPIAVHAATTLGDELGPFYAPCELLKSQKEKGVNWNLDGEVDESKIQAGDRSVLRCLPRCGRRPGRRRRGLDRGHRSRRQNRSALDHGPFRNHEQNRHRRRPVRRSRPLSANTRISKCRRSSFAAESRWKTV